MRIHQPIVIRQAERISSLPNKITLDLHISKFFISKIIKPVATSSLFDGKVQQILLIGKRRKRNAQVGEIWRTDVKLDLFLQDLIMGI